MMDNLTVENFLATLSCSQIKRLFKDSLWSQNLVALPVTFKELMRRGKLYEVTGILKEAFELDFEFKYRSAFANVFSELLYDYRKTVPFFVTILRNLENNVNDNGSFTKEKFREIYFSNNDAYFGMITAKDLAIMETVTWVAILKYEEDVCQQENPYEPEALPEIARERLRKCLNRQVMQIVHNTDLRLGMNARIRDELNIDELFDTYVNARRGGGAVEEEG